MIRRSEAIASKNINTVKELPIDGSFVDAEHDSPLRRRDVSIAKDLRRFKWNGRQTQVEKTEVVLNRQPAEIETFVNEFWTSKQRVAHSLHEISYRACFKPQLPRFFIQRLTNPGDLVYDPFMGRGTTLLEAVLLQRAAVGCDVNPLGVVLTKPRLSPPDLSEITSRMRSIDLQHVSNYREELTVFYHPETLREICALREYFLRQKEASLLDDVDQWIRMVAVNRLTGHSSGFFSVYTLPPNQAVSLESQRKINADRCQSPPRRDVTKIILNKSRSLLRNCDGALRVRLRDESTRSLLLTQPSKSVPEIRSSSVKLVVTSPPFLDVVDYAGDNWLRWWFCGIDSAAVTMILSKRLEEWKVAMTEVFSELHRVLVPGGHVAFEVGEIRGGKIRLEEAVVPCGVLAGLKPVLVLINSQNFTKTANCWGVSNNTKGTNTNRVVLFRKS